MGVKKDFMQACKNKDTKEILEILKDHPEENLFTDTNIGRIISIGDIELVKNIFTQYKINISFKYIMSAIYSQNVDMCKYLLEGYNYCESDLNYIPKMIYYISWHDEVVDILEDLIDIYYEHGNKNYILEASPHASEDVLKIFRKKVLGFDKKRKEPEKNCGVQLDISGISTVINEFYEEEKRREEAAKLPWEKHEDSIPLIVAIENSEISDNVILNLLDAGATYQNDGEAMKLAEKMGRDVVVEHMRNLLKK